MVDEMMVFIRHFAAQSCVLAAAINYETTSNWAWIVAALVAAELARSYGKIWNWANPDGWRPDFKAAWRMIRDDPRRKKYGGGRFD